MTDEKVVLQIFDEIDSNLLQNIYNKTRGLPDGAEVDLEIASYGGEIFSAMGIIDTLKRFHTHAYIIGFACSAAAILALSCDEITISKHGSMMIHSAWADGVDADDPGIQHSNELQLKIISERCPDYNTELLATDHWLSANECLKLHFVDNINYNEDTFDYAAMCKKYAAKLNKLYAKGGCTMAEEVKLDEVLEQVKEDEEKKEDEVMVAEEEPMEENHDLVEVIEKLSEKISEIEARLKALEEPVEDEEPKVEEDDEQDRINSIYKNLVRPQACAPVACATAKKALRQVPKGFDKYLD